MPKYRASAESGVGFLIPKAADNSRKIKEQGEAYIRQLKAIRDAETARELTNLNEYEKTVEKGQRWATEVGEQRRSQAMAVAQLKVESMKQQQKRSEAITGSKSNFQGGSKWMKFLTDTAPTAAKLYGEYKEKQTEIDKVEGRNLAALFPHTSDQAGFTHQLGTSSIISADADTMAAVAASQGANQETIEALRGANSTKLNEVKYALSKRVGQQAANAFQESLIKDNGFTVLIDGEEVPLNALPSQDTQTLTKAWTQFMPEYFDKAGFGKASNEFLTAGVSIAQQGWTEWMGGKREQELEALQSNRDQEQQNLFTTDISIPGNEVKGTLGYFNYQFNQSGGDYKSAVTSTLDMLSNTALVTDQQFEAALDTPMGDANNPNDKRSIKERFPQLVKDAREKRSNDIGQEIQSASIQKRADAKKVEEQLRQGYLADLGDNNLIDVDPETLSAKAAEYRMLGPEYKGVADMLDNLIPLTANAQLDEQLVDQWTEAEANGSLTTWMVMSSGASKEVKRTWAEKANASSAALPGQTSVDQFKKYAEVTLRERVKFAPGSGQVQGRDLALKEREAIAIFKQDYKTAKLSGKTDAEAYAYAEGRFNTEFDRGTGDTATGRYKLTGESERDANGVIRPGRYSTDIDQVQLLENPMAPVVAAFKDTPAQQAITKPIVPRETLEIVLQQANGKGMIPAMPPMVVEMSNLTGGRFSPLQILQAQLEANDLDPLPDNILNPATEAQMSVNPEMQKFLNYKPSITRTDVAMVGSGQEPIYAPTTATQEQVKAIFSSRESPQAEYDAINRGSGGDTPGGATKRYGKPLTQMTLGEVKQLQAQELNAVGKYQFIESTLAQAAVDAGISDDMLFNEAVQDRIFFTHLDIHGAYNPWERWWIEQGGSHLALTAEEKNVISAFRASYDPSKPWRQPKNTNPELIRRGVTVPSDEIPRGGPELEAYLRRLDNGELTDE